MQDLSVLTRARHLRQSITAEAFAAQLAANEGAAQADEQLLATTAAVYASQASLARRSKSRLVTEAPLPLKPSGSNSLLAKRQPSAPQLANVAVPHPAEEHNESKDDTSCPPPPQKPTLMDQLSAVSHSMHEQLQRLRSSSFTIPESLLVKPQQNPPEPLSPPPDTPASPAPPTSLTPTSPPTTTVPPTPKPPPGSQPNTQTSLFPDIRDGSALHTSSPVLKSPASPPIQPSSTVEFGDEGEAIRMTLMRKVKEWQEEVDISALQKKHGSLSMKTVLLLELASSIKELQVSTSVKPFERFLQSVLPHNEDSHEGQLKIMACIFANALEARFEQEQREQQAKKEFQDMVKHYEKRIAVLSRHVEKTLNTRTQLSKDREHIFSAISTSMNEILSLMKSIERLVLAGREADMKIRNRDLRDRIGQCVHRMEQATKTKKGLWDERKLELLGVQRDGWRKALQTVKDFDCCQIFMPKLRNQAFELQRFETEVLANLPEVRELIEAREARRLKNSPRSSPQTRTLASPLSSTTSPPRSPDLLGVSTDPQPPPDPPDPLPPTTPPNPTRSTVRRRWKERKAKEHGEALRVNLFTLEDTPALQETDPLCGPRQYGWRPPLARQPTPPHLPPTTSPSRRKTSWPHVAEHPAHQPKMVGTPSASRQREGRELLARQDELIAERREQVKALKSRLLEEGYVDHPS